jgi:hypothetical protein
MASKEFEVYFRFSDEVQASEFMERTADESDLSHYGIRRVDPDDFPRSLFKKRD